MIYRFHKLVNIICALLIGALMTGCTNIPLQRVKTDSVWGNYTTLEMANVAIDGCFLFKTPLFEDVEIKTLSGSMYVVHDPLPFDPSGKWTETKDFRICPYGNIGLAVTTPEYIYAISPKTDMITVKGSWQAVYDGKIFGRPNGDFIDKDGNRKEYTCFTFVKDNGITWYDDEYWDDIEVSETIDVDMPDGEWPEKEYPVKK